MPAWKGHLGMLTVIALMLGGVAAFVAVAKFAVRPMLSDWLGWLAGPVSWVVVAAGIGVIACAVAWLRRMMPPAPGERAQWLSACCIAPWIHVPAAARSHRNPRLQPSAAPWLPDHRLRQVSAQPRPVNQDLDR